MRIISEMGELNQYDGTELRLVVDYANPDGSRDCEPQNTIELSDVDLSTFNDPIVFYSVYLHPKIGGTVCVADFDQLDDAQILCHALDCLIKVQS